MGIQIQRENWSLGSQRESGIDSVKNENLRQAVVACAFNLSTHEAERGESL